MAKHFGESRNPSMGYWGEEARLEEDNLHLKKRPVHRTTAGSVGLEKEEDKLIDQIDNGPYVHEDDIQPGREKLMAREPHRAPYIEDAPDFKDETANDSGIAGPETEDSKGKGQQNILRPPRNDVFKPNRAQKSYLTKEQKTDSAHIRKIRKDNLEQRSSL